MLDIGIVTGTGATNASGIRIAPPTGATNNYLISHATPGTFNVTAAGAGTFGSRFRLAERWRLAQPSMLGIGLPHYIRTHADDGRRAVRDYLVSDVQLDGDDLRNVPVCCR